MPHENILPSEKTLEFGVLTNNYDILTVRTSEPREVIRIASDGKIYWLGREVNTDEEFKHSMLDMHRVFKEMNLNK